MVSLKDLFLLMNAHFILFGDFEFSLDLCFLDIPDRLSSECFGVHR